MKINITKNQLQQIVTESIKRNLFENINNNIVNDVFNLIEQDEIDDYEIDMTDTHGDNYEGELRLYLTDENENEISVIIPIYFSYYFTDYFPATYYTPESGGEVVMKDIRPLSIKIEMDNKPIMKKNIKPNTPEDEFARKVIKTYYGEIYDKWERNF